MKKGLIITMPQYDVVTEYFSQFSKEILKEAKGEDLPIKSLVGKEVVKSFFESVAEDFPYNILVLNGHGTAEEIFGQDKKPLIAEGVNERLLAGRITYARACEAGASLGKSVALLNKDGCFIGYKLPFQFYGDITWETNPIKDNTARIFLGPSNAIPIALIHGKTASEAHENAKRMTLKNLNKVLRNIDKDSLAIAEALWNNYDGQVLLGKGDASLNS
jgi:hypothetical protein